MYKWRLLLFASFAVFQPIASFTERNLVDGRQECCDRLPYSLQRDTKLAVYGTYRVNELAPENRHLNTRREISYTRRDEIKDLRADFTRLYTTERRGSQQRDLSRFSEDREARVSRVERRRIGTSNIRDARERSSPDDRDYRVSLYRLSYNEGLTRLGNERQSRLSTESEQRVERMRDNTQIIRNNEVRQAQNMLQGTRNDKIRRDVTTTLYGRRVTRETDLGRRSYLSRADTRHEDRNRNFVDQRAREVDEYRISSPRVHIIETRKMDDENGNHRLVTRDSKNKDRRLTSSRFESESRIREIVQRSFDRNTNEISKRIQATDNSRLQRFRNTRSELRENVSGDEHRIVKRDNRRLTRATNERDRDLTTNRNQINDERKVVDQHKRDSHKSSISAERFNQNRDRNNELRNNERRERLSEIDMRFERNVMGVERRVASRSLDRRDSLVVRSRRDAYILRRHGSGSGNNVRDEYTLLRIMPDSARLFNSERQSISQRTNIVNNIRERQWLERVIRNTNDYRLSIHNEETRNNFNEYRNVGLNDRHVGRERMELQRRISVFLSPTNSRETRHLEQRFTRRSEQNKRFLESRVIELFEQVRQVKDITHANLLAESREERRSVSFDIPAIEKDNQRRNTRVSRDRVSRANREVRIDQTQRSTDNFRQFNLRERLENAANARNQRVRNSEERRATSDIRLTESRMSKDRALTRDVDSRLKQRNHYETFQGMQADEIARDIQYKSKQDTDRTMTDSRARLSVSGSTQNRDTFVATSEKVPSFTPFGLDWQCVFYTLHCIYIFGVVVQMLNDNGPANDKVKSFRWLGAATRSAIKID